jgi:hypothetical protein
MKNIIIAASLLIALSSTAFTKDKNVNTDLLKDLTSTFKKSTDVCWMDKPQYKEAMFKFKNQIACAFYNKENNDLIGFGILFEKAALPQVVTDAVKKDYANWDFVDAMMFVDTDGNVNYFMQVKNNKKIRALKITPGGTVSIYARIAS